MHFISELSVPGQQRILKGEFPPVMDTEQQSLFSGLRISTYRGWKQILATFYKGGIPSQRTTMDIMQLNIKSTFRNIVCLGGWGAALMVDSASLVSLGSGSNFTVTKKGGGADPRIG
jgi:hypothetical protein